MKKLGLQRVKIEDLKKPENWNELIESQEVEDRAKSIETWGLIHEPLVRKKDMLLILGNRRTAAHAVNGNDTIVVMMVECADGEIEGLRITENLERHHASPEERRELTTRLVDIYAELYADEPEPPGPPNQGPKKTPRGKAREVVAAQQGVHPETIRKTEWRHKEGQERAQREAQDPKPPPIEVFGIDVEQEYIDDVSAVIKAVDAAASAVQKALKALRELKKNAAAQVDPLSPVLATGREFHKRIKGYRPASLCVSCKGLPDYQDDCPSCCGTGWSTAEQYNVAPKDLKEGQEEDLRVLIDGKPQSIELEEEPEEEYVL